MGPRTGRLQDLDGLGRDGHRVLTPLGTGLIVFVFVMRDRSHRPLAVRLWLCSVELGDTDAGTPASQLLPAATGAFASILIGYGLKPFGHNRKGCS